MNIHQEATPYIKYTKLTRTNFKFYFSSFQNVNSKRRVSYSKCKLVKRKTPLMDKACRKLKVFRNEGINI